MRRRDLLLFGAATAGALVTRRVLAQVQPDPARAAVVIGVNHAGSLPPLGGAASGAHAIGDFLAAEGFQVERFIDDDAPVTVKPITTHIKELVNRGTLEQLVIYFAGHGFLHTRSEHWMLSESTEDPNEAFSLAESVDLAKQTGIRNVVLISDACRSTPDSLGISQVRGSLLFPVGTSKGGVKVDKFLATLPGSASLEVPIGVNVQEYEGIYTACFLQAFKTPDEGMVVKLSDGREVIPNWKLEKYLAREVPKRAREAAKTLEQVPETDVTFDPEREDWIARAAMMRPPPPVAAAAPVTVSDVAEAQFALAIGAAIPTAPDDVLAEVEAVAVASGFNEARDAVVEAAMTETVVSNCTEIFCDASTGTRVVSIDNGFTISGIEVAEVAAADGVASEIIAGESRTAVRVDMEGSAASVAVRFADGTGTVVPVLRGFTANVTVFNGGVSNMSYDFSGGTPDDYVTRLRAVVATAAKYGVFRVKGDPEQRIENARRLGDTVRMGKGADPTLGLYAAYAYNEGDLQEDLDSVVDIMRSNLSALLFDVAMLAGDLSGQPPRDDVFPFCPMLSQGWSLLRVRDVRLAEAVVDLRDHLVPALWTTFDPEGVEIAFNALKNGHVR